MKPGKSLCLLLFFVIFSAIFAININAQERSRIVEKKLGEANYHDFQPESSLNSTPEVHSQTVSLPTNNSRRSMLTNDIKIVNPPQAYKPLVKKISDSRPINSVSSSYISKSSYGTMFNHKLLQSIQTKIGIPYRYGSDGPTSYDCSGLVWSVFQDAGYLFERTSARTLWQNSETVEGDDKFKFGTLVFFNGLGHIGIVAGENGFYHASSSQGVTYSTFKGYWGKRIVGFRRMNLGAVASR